MSPIHVLAAVVKRDSEYLVCRRPAHKRHGNLWEFPGGKLEEGETHYQAARRELFEELGVDTLSVNDVIFSSADPGSEFQIDFVQTVIQGEPRCIEHSELRWVTVSGLLQLDLAPTDRRFAEFLHQRDQEG